MRHTIAAGLLACLSTSPTFACQVGLEAFNALRVGMSTTEVTDLLGCQGMVRSSQTVEEYSTKIIAWKEAKDGLGQVDVMFQSGVLVAKSHYGLD